MRDNIYISWIPACFAIGVLGEITLKSDVPGFVAFAVWAVAGLVVGTRVVGWRCPRCGKWFSVTSFGFNMGFLARKCAHCGLPKYANHG